MEVHLSKLGEMAKAREGWRAAVRGVTESDTTEQPNNKTNKLERARKRILFHREHPGEQRLKSPPATHIVDS